MVANPSSIGTSPPDSLIARLFHHAKENPSHDAVLNPDLKLSYGQLARLVRLQAEKLYEAGVSSDSVIGIKCTDDTQHLVLCLAGIHVGATSVTIPSHESVPIQNSIIDRCGVSYVADENIGVDPMRCDTKVGSVPMEAAAQLLFATSGTTGNAKLVLHQDRDLVAQAHRHIGSMHERFTCLASMEHNFAKRHRLYCVATGASNVFLGADRDSLVAQCQALKVNVMHLSAFQAQELLAVPGISKLSGIRLKLGGSHVPLSLRQQLRSNITENLQAGYGTTETGAIAFTDPADRDAGESVGQALPGIEIRAVSPGRQLLAPGKHGELAVRCNGIFREYFNDPDLTAARLEEGWFYTGDVGYLDDRQRIHLCGRSDDMFVFNSMNIYPQDIESRICQFPGVADAVVLPKESSVHGCIPVALIVFAKGAKHRLPELRKYLSEHEGIRSPRQFIVVNEIPRNASGKISRQKSANLSSSIDQHRKFIVQSLDSNIRDKLKASTIAAFENGDTDITLREIEMDSLARMELLVALEVNYDLIITPKEFGESGSLGKIAARVLSKQMQVELEQDTNTQLSSEENFAPVTGLQPYVVKFFQRIFSYCHTVAQLNKALTTLEHRLTPFEIEVLCEKNRNRQLIPSSSAAKYHTVITLWLDRMKGMMLDSGKSEPEPFVLQRIAPTVIHFIGPGAPAEKTLLVCFSTKGWRTLMMPNAVLMQHTDSARYDLLVISEPLNQGYERGVPLLGKNVTEVIEWIAKQELIGAYRHIRTLGSSAGSYPAVLAGHLLGAELAVSVGGRFHSARHPGKILKRILTIRRTVRRGSCERVLMCYGKDKTRDRNFAWILAWLCGGSMVAVEFINGSAGHHILERFVERRKLAQFLAGTIFAGMSDEIVTTERADVIMSFPGGQVRNA